MVPVTGFEPMTSCVFQQLLSTLSGCQNSDSWCIQSSFFRQGLRLLLAYNPYASLQVVSHYLVTSTTELHRQNYGAASGTWTHDQ